MSKRRASNALDTAEQKKTEQSHAAKKAKKDVKAKIEQPRAAASNSAVAHHDAVSTGSGKSGASVDRNCFNKLPTRDRVHVLTEGANSWSAMLNQTNISSNNNKFYVIQLLQSDKGTYFVYFRWGRVGKVGQDQLHPCGTDLSKAKALFEEKFAAKTKNEFSNRARFKKVAGKYDLIDVQPDEEELAEDVSSVAEVKQEADTNTNESETKTRRKSQVAKRSGQANAAANSKSASASASASVSAKSGGSRVKTEATSSSGSGSGLRADASTVPCKLEIRVQNFLDEIFDRRLIEQTMRELDYDTERLPLGRLTPAQIRAGYASLSDIERLVKEGQYGQLSNACSSFYTKIPHVFGMRRPPLISSLAEVRAKQELLETLETVCVAVRISDSVRSAATNSKAVPLHPLDAHLERLECSVRIVEREEPAYALITRYVANTHGSTHTLYSLDVLECYEVSRRIEVEAAAHRATLGGRTLLWHGTRRSNLAGILKAGLLIAPPEAPITGWMFDKGVYFADCVSKSANYCHATGEHNEHFLLLCEVALGRPAHLVEADYSARRNVRADSVIGVGTWAPEPQNSLCVRVPKERDSDFSTLVHEQLGSSLNYRDAPNAHELDAQVVSVPCGRIVRAVPLSENALVRERVAGRGLTGYVLNYNEFVVYDVRQIRMRYAVKVRFNFK